ncbi:unnamed protein product [Acanthoscelides obtectus]|uniref:Uncharacterized protein n=1 Tax=Acanthoscelides obtectus TaxID=200917 RepID=A0A9P0PIU9_ACAOB|nr:unnamed protein product [Acanthoscelides obtectus]CAK1623397.1 hypothetical protein AOBTE_LOCUS1983 [Acanthoscelides obtectus]
MWHHPAAAHSAVPVFQHEFTDFIHNTIPALQHSSPQGATQAPPPDCVAGPMEASAPGGQQLSSPPVTVSGSEMSSPGGNSAGTATPPHHMHHHHMGGAGHQGRPAPARSPFEWIKKTSYQTQPNPVDEAMFFYLSIQSYSFYYSLYDRQITLFNIYCFL